MDKTMSAPPGNLKNVLNSDVEIKGDLKCSGEMTFDGKIDGDIHADGALTLGDTSGVNGNVNAQSAVVRGKVNGNIVAREKLEMKAKSELFGDIRAAKLTIEEGVVFVGKAEINPNKIAQTPPVQRPGEAPKGAETPKPLGR
jgi:cytoskeletal protein CcmA (bactofilin family)